MDKAFENVVEEDKIEDNHGVKSSVASYNGKILYYLNDGIFRYDVFNKGFVKDTFLSEFLEDKKYLSGKLISDNSSNRLWAFPKDGIVYMEPGKFTEEPEMNLIPITGDIRQSKPGYENILYLNNNKYLVGTTEGYLIIDLDRLEGGTYNIDLNQIAYKSDQHHFESLDLNLQPSLDSANNSLLFNFSVTNYNKLSSTNYQYRLLGIYDEWSNWSTEPEVLFENLPHGDYTFEARAITNGKLSENTVKYNFSVSKPWYLKPIALSFYVLIAVLIAYLIHYLTRRYYRKQRENLIKKKAQELELEQLENQRQLIEFKNKNLQFDIENKNRELGIATMNLVKRNELLNNLKDELTKTKSLDGLKNVIKLINTSLNSTGDWKLFEEAFNNVDKDFMKKIKTLHPAITPNDLRLCTYLRLNLSSKEIAPLLNISHKSVEVKRYRLRKKMGLEHDQSLSNYIIEL